MSDKRQGEKGFLGELKGNLMFSFLRVVQWTPLGVQMGLNPYINLSPSEELKIALNDTLRDVVRDAFVAAKWIGTGGDGISANATGDDIEQWWRKRVTANIGMGVAEFRMGGGWPLPAGMLYNGKIDKEKEDKKLPLDSVFVRYKDGKVEVLDHNDPRYYELVVPYIIGQLAVPAGVSKATAALKAISASSKVATLAIGTAGYVASTADFVGGVGIAGQMFLGEMVLKPEAIRQIAKIMESPENQSTDRMRHQLNKALEQFAYRNGPMLESIYVPPLKPTDNPMRRLAEISRGSVSGFQVSDPFKRIEDLSTTSPHYVARLPMGDIKGAIKPDPYFQRGYLGLLNKAANGSKLSDTEMTLLLFASNVYNGQTRDIFPKNGKSFTEEEKRDLYKTALDDFGDSVGVPKLPDKTAPEDMIAHSAKIIHIAHRDLAKANAAIKIEEAAAERELAARQAQLARAPML